jgi:hypothetical protein
MTKPPRRKPAKIGTNCPLPVDDPRGLNHQVQRPALIEFAKAIGRHVAEQEYKRVTNEAARAGWDRLHKHDGESK